MTTSRTSTHRELGHFVESLIINNSTNNDGNTIPIHHFGHVLSNGTQRHWRTVDARHKQTFQNDLVEMGPCTASQVTVQLQYEQ